MRRVPPIVWATGTPPTSIGSTKVSSAFPRCATCNGCEKWCLPALSTEQRERLSKLMLSFLAQNVVRMEYERKLCWKEGLSAQLSLSCDILSAESWMLSRQKLCR